MSQSKKISWIRTKEFIILNQKGTTLNIHITDPRYGETLELLKSEEWERLISFLNPFALIDEYTQGTFYVENGVMVIRGMEEFPVHSSIAERIIDFRSHGLPYEPLIKFWVNVSKNPNPHSREQLYRFLEHNKMPITQDGYFIAYKKVTKVNDCLFDSHTGKYKNDPGSRLIMNRDDVNPDPNTTCSHGLHVAAYEYANGFSGNVMVQVKVNPRDVVAVPVDYNNQKIRCCEYLVMCIIDGELKEMLHEGDSTESEIQVKVAK
jgi:hypothetical protein